MLIKIIVCVIGLGVNISNAQMDNPREQKPYGLSINMLGPTGFLSLSADYFTSPTINIEFGAGYMGCYGCVKYHINGSKNISTTKYIGISYSIVNFNFPNMYKDNYNFIFIPIGLTKNKKNGFTFGGDVALAYNINTNKIGPWGGIKIGYHF